MTHRRAHPGILRRAERGVTFLEIVLSSVILALTVASIATAVNAMSGQQRRAQHRLNAAELANRLLIQYLDDETLLPNEELSVAYGEHHYRYKKRVSRVNAALDPVVQEAVEEDSLDSPLTPERLRKVSITVWLGERSGGSLYENTGAPQVTLVRLVDPSAVWRRPPDAIQAILEKPEGQYELMQRILGRDEDELE